MIARSELPAAVEEGGMKEPAPPAVASGESSCSRAQEAPPVQRDRVNTLKSFAFLISRNMQRNYEEYVFAHKTLIL